MANTVTKTTLVDGSQVLVVKVDIIGDGSGEETATTIVDASTFSPAFTDEHLMKITYACDGCSGRLLWDATADVHAWTITGVDSLDFTCFGGIQNSAGSGVTGDINITTVGLGSGDSISMVMEIRKN